MRPTVVILALAVSAASCQEGTADQAGPPAGKLPPISSIEGDPVSTLLGPDAIRAIDAPRFVPASQAGFMRPDEPVIGVVLNGIAKAYSAWHLDHHEIVNDTFGNTPVAVTW